MEVWFHATYYYLPPMFIFALICCCIYFFHLYVIFSFHVFPLSSPVIFLIHAYLFLPFFPVSCVWCCPATWCAVTPTHLPSHLSLHCLGGSLPQLLKCHAPWWVCLHVSSSLESIILRWLIDDECGQILALWQIGIKNCVLLIFLVEGILLTCRTLSVGTQEGSWRTTWWTAERVCQKSCLFSLWQLLAKAKVWWNCRYLKNTFKSFGQDWENVSYMS